jgi:alkaline phosphatase
MYFKNELKSAQKRKALLCAALCLSCSLTVPVFFPDPVEAAGYTMAAPSPIRILPINRAKLLKGQKFDFEIEAQNIPAASLKVTIDGQPADKYFQKKAVYGQNGTISSYRIDNVSFPQAGQQEIKVTSPAAARSANYTVTDVKAPQRAKNVILFIGDGMSLPAREMARILSKGIEEGKYHDTLEMEKMPNLAVVTTSGYDSLVTDSANSASAYATGQKGVVNAMGVYENSTKDPLDDPKVENIVELAKRTRNMATGLVSTANITDATPAAMIAHTRRRAELNFIAKSMLDPVHRPEVILGGGAMNFLPMSIPGSKRKDNDNLISDFKKLGYSFSGSKNELLKTSSASDKLLGLYNMNNMDVYLDREVLKDPKTLGKFTDQPTLMDMTQKAISTLSKNKNGFFLMVEGACIDKQLHTMDWQRATYDTIEFDKAIGLGRAFAARNHDTLLIVVADHSHGASITGTYSEKNGKTGREAVGTYAAAGWPTFEDRDGDGFPDNPDADVTLAIQYANHPDANLNYTLKPRPISPAIMDGKIAIANPKLTGEFAPGNIPANENSEVHSADDVLLNAEGPGSDYFHGVMDNTEVFFGMARALGLDGTKNAAK